MVLLRQRNLKSKVGRKQSIKDNRLRITSHYFSLEKWFVNYFVLRKKCYANQKTKRLQYFFKAYGILLKIKKQSIKKCQKKTAFANLTRGQQLSYQRAQKQKFPSHIKFYCTACYNVDKSLFSVQVIIKILPIKLQTFTLALDTFLQTS